MNKVRVISAIIALTLTGTLYAAEQTTTQSSQAEPTDHTIYMLSKLHSYNADAIENNGLAIQKQQVLINKQNQQINEQTQHIHENADSVGMLVNLHHNNYELTEDNKNAIAQQQQQIDKNTQTENTLIKLHQNNYQQIRTNLETNSAQQLDIDAQKLQIEAQHQQVQTNTDDVKFLATSNYNNHVQTEKNSDDIAAQQLEIDKQTQQVQTNTRTVNQNIDQVKLRLATDGERIINNSNEISVLQQDFEKMRGHINGAYAESAAFAGLVAPYGVGKFAISAAIGHHEDQEAVAIGVGERFTENVTAKLGGAYDTATETVSVYAGVGFEF